MKRRESGFTLIEMMVALAIFSLAALALIRLQGYTLKNTAELELQVMAQSVVRNRATEILTDPRSPAGGISEGKSENGGIVWIWTQDAKLTEDGQFVQVEILAKQSGGGASAGLTILKPSAAAVKEITGTQ